MSGGMLGKEIDALKMEGGSDPPTNYFTSNTFSKFTD